MKNRNWHITLTIIAFFLGLGITIQVRTQQELNPANYPLRRAGDLLVMLQNAEKRRDELALEVSELRQKIFALAEENSPGMRTEIEKARVLAGLTPVTGQGIELVLSEEEYAPAEEDSELWNLPGITEEDLWRVVNELRASGAEAIAINGQRITALSEIRDTKRQFVVNGVSINAPFTIQATGNPQTLERALTMSGGLIDALRICRIQARLEVKNKLELPPYQGAIRFYYTMPSNGDK
ncbi:MAG: DUF881 domain-containing protein [Bacillota bacterium]